MRGAAIEAVCRAVKSGHDFFDPATGALVFHCTLPPPDNACHTSAPGGMRFATKQYKAWLEEWGPVLRALLGEWEPDAVHWWSVQVGLRLSGSGDAQNYLKPLIDLLSGSCINPETFTDANGKKVYKGKLLKPGGLWDDDRRVIGSWRVETIRDPSPGLTLIAMTTPNAPRDLKAEADAAKVEAKAERDRARVESLAAKQSAAEKAERRRYFLRSWEWKQTSKKPRSFNGYTDFEGRRLSMTMTEDGPLRWITQGSLFPCKVGNGALAEVRKAAILAVWERLEVGK